MGHQKLIGFYQEKLWKKVIMQRSFLITQILHLRHGISTVHHNQTSVFCGHIRAIYKPVQLKRYRARKTSSQLQIEKNQNVFIHQNFGIFVNIPPIKLPNIFKIGVP